MLTLYSSRKILRASKIFVIITLMACVPHSLAQSTFLGLSAEKPEAGYYSMVLGRFFSWYKENFFDFDKVMTNDEKKLIQEVIKDVDQSRDYLDSVTKIPKFRLIIQADAEKIFFGNIFLALNKATKSSFDLAKKIIKQRNLKISSNLDLDNLIGMQWSEEGSTLSLFFRKSPTKGASATTEFEFTQIDYLKREVIRELHWGLPEEGPTEGLFMDGVIETRSVTSKDKKMSYVVSTLLPTRIFTEALKNPLRKITKEFSFGPQAALVENQKKVWIYY